MTDVRDEIQHYLGTRRELEEKRRRGDIDNLHYLIKQGHLSKVFAARCPMGDNVLSVAHTLLMHYTVLSKEERYAKIQLMQYDREALETYMQDFLAANVERVALKVLEGMESVVVPPIPAPRPEAVERHEAAHNHRIEQRDWPRPLGAGEYVPFDDESRGR